jgi:hypothetical protein
MALTISEQATRRDHAGFRAQVSAVLDEEVRDMLNKVAQWTDAIVTDAAARTARDAFARRYVSSAAERSDVLDVACRLAVASTPIKNVDLVGAGDGTIPTASASTLRTAVRNAIRVLVALPEV